MSPLRTSERTLKLQVNHLTDSDIAKIAAFLRIGRERLSRDWQIVFEDGHDVLGHLAHPLQYEDVIDALQALERRLAAQPATAGVQLRLRRWPAHALLQGDADRPRLASFLLSARQIDIDELTRLSHVDRLACEAFVAALMAADVLDVMPAAPLRPDVAGPDATRSPDQGTFGEIRRSLGLA
jgi:hypothetical protein